MNKLKVILFVLGGFSLISCTSTNHRNLASNANTLNMIIESNSSYSDIRSCILNKLGTKLNVVLPHGLDDSNNESLTYSFSLDHNDSNTYSNENGQMLQLIFKYNDSHDLGDLSYVKFNNIDGLYKCKLQR